MMMVNQKDPFDNLECISDLAWMLNELEDAEQLFELQQVPEFTKERLNRSCQTLPFQKQEKIREWAIANKQRKLSPVV